MADVVEAVGGGELEPEDHVPHFWTLDDTVELGGCHSGFEGRLWRLVVDR